ncbi:MAG: hypothetical protein KKD77_23570 [Gammaproteobacteria bacterium]|nr:hypothetical protein [Gammaproteobacteria bacterium]
MLTKKIVLDKSVLEIIESMEWNYNGTLGKITCGQLDRDVYEKVNLALEQLGGKWNRKQGGHVFAMDPRPRVKGLVESGVLTVERDGFFETPFPIVQWMLERVTPVGRLLEPQAGLGAIVEHLPRKNLVSVDPKLG